MKIFWQQCKIEIIRMCRNPYYVFWALLMPMIFYIIYTKILNTDILNKALWDKEFLMSVAMFSIMGSAIMTFGIRLVQERSEGWTVFMRITPVSNLVYFSAKMAAQTLIHLGSITLIFISGKFLNGISMSTQEWLMCGAWLMAGSLPFLAIGVLIGMIKRVDTAGGIANFVFIFLAVTGGITMPLEVFPAPIQVLSSWLPVYNYGMGAWSIVNGGMPEMKNIAILTSYLVIFMLLSIYIRKKQEVVQQ